MTKTADGLPLFDYTLLKSVRAVCPRCFAENADFDPAFPDDICDGHLVSRDGAVYLRRFCRRGHGEVWSLYEERADLWSYLQQWRVPTRAIRPDTATIHPVPSGYEFGLGPAHLQHSCILLLDLTTQCNLSCPACFTSSSPSASHYLPLDDALHAVETVLEREGGRLDVVMLSGGEPTIHPQIVPLLEALAALPITRVLLNTNGIRLANDDAFLDVLHGYRDRVEVYLQYDGPSAETSMALRGTDLRATKSRAIERLSAAQVFTTLVMTVTLANAHEVGAVLDTCFATPFVGGAMFQPIFASGRAPTVDPMLRVTTTGVLSRIEAQSGYGAKAHDLIALPCSHPDCCAIGYFLRGKDGGFASLASIVGEASLQRNLSVFGNSIAFSDGLGEIRAALTNVMSESMTLSRPELLANLQKICSACDLGGFGTLLALAFKPNSTAQFVGERVKRVTVKHFMDANTLITERLEQCCVHVAGAGDDPVRMPFCAARLFPKVRARALEAMLPRGALGSETA
ncbi:MAG: radical SAM protein [Candidatus Eremiobacteraeota bacterium]|nr:radical SAM protein [Candidatus Eremiobacteraeota bacterium]